MKRIAFLDYLRVLAIFMVLVIHSTEPYYLNEDGLFIASALDGVWVSVYEIFCRACVPLFVMTSAYLLFPTSKPTGEFLKLRLVKVGLPFAFWCCVYTAWNGGDWGRMWFNFPMAAGGHLWFVPMLFGLYFLMPLLSPWAERAREKEVRGWLIAWLFTTIFPFIRWIFAAVYGNGWAHVFGEANFDNIPFLWGECGWNSFGTFHYISGFFGYMLLGFWLRKFRTEWSRTGVCSVVAMTAFFGAAIMLCGFGTKACLSRVYPLAGPYPCAVSFETAIEYCSIGVVATTFAWFLAIRTWCTGEGRFYRYVILPLSGASYGVYLIHILILVPISALLKPILPTVLAIPATATAAFAISSVIVLILKRLPIARRLV